MIEAKDLRIGNKVDLYGSIATIETVDFAGIGIAIKEGKPIPLTEEWLLKFGFVYTDDVENLNRDYKLQEFEIQLHLDVNDFICCNTIPNYVQIKYVHQLQNLYFDLTNEELTLNK